MYGKIYASDEEEKMRKTNFINVEKQIQLQSSINNREDGSFLLTHNSLSDLVVLNSFFF